MVGIQPCRSRWTRFVLLLHQRHAAVPLEGVALVVLKRVGIDVLPDVRDLSVGGAVPAGAYIAGLKEGVAPPVVDPELEIISR